MAWGQRAEVEGQVDRDVSAGAVRILGRIDDVERVCVQESLGADDFPRVRTPHADCHVRVGPGSLDEMSAENDIVERVEGGGIILVGVGVLQEGNVVQGRAAGVDQLDREFGEAVAVVEINETMHRQARRHRAVKASAQQGTAADIGQCPRDLLTGVRGTVIRVIDAIRSDRKAFQWGSRRVEFVTREDCPHGRRIIDQRAITVDGKLKLGATKSDPGGWRRCDPVSG